MEDCSRISTQHYKSAPENLSEIARQLGVAHILEGSVQKSGDVVRVNVQLFKAANDEDADALVCNQQCCGEEVKRQRRFSARCKMATGTAHWLDCMERLAECGCEFFMKLRPGNVLGGLLTRIRVRRCSPWATGNQCAYASGRSVPGTSACC